MQNNLAFLFPGQGSQSVGMLGDSAAQFPLIQKTFGEASDQLGYDLWALCQQGPEDLLNQTERTQPALLVASVALWRVWQANAGQEPAYLAGHSLGEYSALVCAGALNFADAVSLVALRGKYMQEAVAEGQGAMAAIIGLNEGQVAQICVDAAQGQALSPANFNAIGQIVIAGESAAVDRAVELAKAAGSKLAKRIPVSVPSHCILMRPAAERLAQALEKITFSAPKIPVVNNADVACYNAPEDIRSALVRQLYSPVRWVETVQFLARQGVNELVECGPGKVLAGLVKRIEKDMMMVDILSVRAGLAG